MKSIWDISNYKTNDIVTTKNIDELLKLQQQLWDNDKYYYDVKEAKRFIKFTRKLTPDKGKKNQKLRLCVFQFQNCTDILCVKHRATGKRRFREALIDEARKNGKSFVVGLILTYLYFFAPEYGGEFILASVSRPLANLLFNQVMHFIENTPLEKYCKIRKSVKEVFRKEDNTYLRVISSDAGNANSYADFVFCLDEVHEFKNQDLYARLSTGQGIFGEPLGILISTASSGEDETNLEFEKYNYAKAVETGQIDDETFYYAIYEADEGCNVESPEQWLKANPALDVFRGRTDIEILAKRAQLSKYAERFFRRFILNQHISSEIENAIDMDLWDECTIDVDYEEIKGLPNTAGLDLSASCDITAFVQLFNDEKNNRYIVYPHLFVAYDRIEDKERDDRVPYSQWVKLGYINAFAGGYINYKKVQQYITDNSINNEILAFDRWGSPAIKQNLEDKFNMLDFGQGYRSMSPAINTFEELLIDKKIVIASNPCLRWMAKITVALTDDAGNVKYSKRKSRKKIDGIIAMVMAIGAMFADREFDYENSLNDYLERF